MHQHVFYFYSTGGTMLKRTILTLFIVALTSVPVIAADSMSVAFSGAEVRSSPSAMSSKVLFKAAKYQPLTVQEQGAEYYKVSDYRGRSGYIHKSLLRDNPSVVVTGDRANVRSGPGTSNEVVFQLGKGAGALLLSQQEGWVEIKSTEGKTGWIADFLVWGE
jgi:N-acetylmuramoyl-L-alanine amidase